MAQLLEKYPDDVRFVYRHLPLIGDDPANPFHDKAALATQATEAAGLQGKFWDMHDLLFERQAEWSALDVPSGCSTYSFIPTPNAELLAIFPPSQDGDWAQGSETASITIIEYSDFQ